MNRRETTRAGTEVDEAGFLLHPQAWTRDIARSMATGELTDDHWKVIDCLREYYLEFDTIPPARLVVRWTGLTLGRIHQLFPEGINHGACRIAGLPRRRVALLNCAEAANSS